MNDDFTPTLCIPRVNANIDKDTIRATLDALQLGHIRRIDVVPNKHDNRVFVHFSAWHDTKNAHHARERLTQGKDIKVIYDEHGVFWKLTLFRELPPRTAPKQP
jgi:diacylglycerol kinase family enzyme